MALGKTSALGPSSPIPSQQAWLERLVQDDETSECDIVESPGPVVQVSPAKQPPLRKGFSFFDHQGGVRTPSFKKTPSFSKTPSFTRARSTPRGGVRPPTPPKVKTPSFPKGTLAAFDDEAAAAAPASSSAAHGEKALDWLALEHKISSVSHQRQAELRTLFMRCAKDPEALMRYGILAAVLVKASGEERTVLAKLEETAPDALNGGDTLSSTQSFLSAVALCLDDATFSQLMRTLLSAPQATKNTCALILRSSGGGDGVGGGVGAGAAASPTSAETPTATLVRVRVTERARDGSVGTNQTTPDRIVITPTRRATL